MDPFVATIVKKSALIVGGFALVGLAVAALYALTQYQSLQYPMTLKMVPPQIA